ncbi:MAG: arginine repressor [Firmicutes bacterium]|nr:arginine repressor [Bacillota bacterium]
MKAKRHRLILDLIESKEIETQEQLTAELSRQGIKVTQATVSRDIKDLGLVKLVTEDGRYKYGLPKEHSPSGSVLRAERIFQEFVTSIERSLNLIIVRSAPGTANTVAAAIDALGWPEICGTIAGDDSLLVIVRDQRAAGTTDLAAIDRTASELETKLWQLRG